MRLLLLAFLPFFLTSVAAFSNLTECNSTYVDLNETYYNLTLNYTNVTDYYFNLTDYLNDSWDDCEEDLDELDDECDDIKDLNATYYKENYEACSGNLTLTLNKFNSCTLNLGYSRANYTACVSGTQGVLTAKDDIIKEKDKMILKYSEDYEKIEVKLSDYEVVFKSKTAEVDKLSKEVNIFQALNDRLNLDNENLKERMHFVCNKPAERTDRYYREYLTLGFWEKKCLANVLKQDYVIIGIHTDPEINSHSMPMVCNTPNMDIDRAYWIVKNLLSRKEDGKLDYGFVEMDCAGAPIYKEGEALTGESGEIQAMAGCKIVPKEIEPGCVTMWERMAEQRTSSRWTGFGYGLLVLVAVCAILITLAIIWRIFKSTR